MAMSKINQPDAQEWLASLQQVGEGWYRNVALAVRAGAHKALDMTPREFAAQIGQRLIDPNPAIIELYNDQPESKKNMAQIAAVLGVSANRVEMVLAKEGYIEMTPRRQKMIDSGMIGGGHHWTNRDAKDAVEDRMPERDSSKEDRMPERDSEEEATPLDEYNALVDEYNELTEAADDAKREHRKEVKDLKEKIKDLTKAAHDAARQAMLDAQAGLTEQERERAKKEADAWAQEQGDKIMAGLSHLLVASITSALTEAAEGVKELVEKGSVTTAHLAEIEEAHAAFIEELNVARMSEQQA